MFAFMNTVRDWMYPPQKKDALVIDTSKAYQSTTDSTKIKEKLNLYHQHYSAYKIDDMVLASTSLISMTALHGFLSYIGTPGLLLVGAEIVFAVYGPSWFRKSYREEQDKKLDELMSIYKWMTTGFNPPVTKDQLYVDVVSVLAAFYNSIELNVWGNRQGDFSDAYWLVMQEPPHYKTRSLHAPSAVEPNASAVVALSKTVVRHWLYAPSKPKPADNSQQEQNQVAQPQDGPSTVLINVGNKAIEFFNMATTIAKTAVMTPTSTSVNAVPKKTN